MGFNSEFKGLIYYFSYILTQTIQCHNHRTYESELLFWFHPKERGSWELF